MRKALGRGRHRAPEPVSSCAAHPRFEETRFKGLATITALLVLLTGGCASPAANPDRHFSGLRDIVADLPAGGTLDIFLVHGMRADSDQTYSDVIAAIAARLPMAEDIPASEEPKYPLVTTDIPSVTLDGVPILSAANWATFQPYLVVAPYHTVDGRHQINFYELNYWRSLALMKCLFIVSPDSLVEGSSSRATYCTAMPWNAKINTRLSGRSEWANRWVKTEIMEWGLADAVIAISPFREVLHRAVRQSLGIALRAALDRDGVQEDVTNPKGEAELSQLRQRDRTRFAFITESLGSYVVHDALNGSGTTSGGHINDVAPFVIVCGASQVYMFANQLALLRLSEIEVSASTSSASAPVTRSEASHSGRSHFFRGCPNQGEGKTGVRGTELAAQQVVAYHDPNDLLTYYTSDRPGYIGERNLDTINVVAPFTGTIIPFLVANPEKAHIGQASSKTIMDSVVCGHQPGEWRPCAASEH